MSSNSQLGFSQAAYQPPRMGGEEENEDGFIGTDGKLVRLKHSSSITKTPWYVDTPSTKPVTSNYEEKRDVYEGYDPETYKVVIQSFSTKKKPKKHRHRSSEKVSDLQIYDRYSRTTHVESSRDRGDTAHYLKDLSAVGNGLEFDDSHELEHPHDPTQPQEITDAGGGAGALQPTGARAAGPGINNSSSA